MRSQTLRPASFVIGGFLALVFHTTTFGQPVLQPIPARPAPPQQVAKGNLLNKTDKLTAQDGMDKLRRTSYCKIYTVDLVAKNKYVIDHMSTNFDCYLRLEDANGRQIAADDDGGNGLNSRISFTPTQNGKYKIYATTLGGRQTGQFTLSVSSIQVAFSKQGKLTASDPLDVIRRNCRFQVVPFKMVKGKVYTIDLEGNYDPYLRLEDARGNNRAQDDDGGAGLNSRLVFRAEETDTYRIIITSCGGGIGPYTLSISE